MGGKAALLLVVGFSMIFLVATQNFGSISSRAVDNMVSYTNETVAHDIAASGANMAANAIFLNNSWTTGYSNVDFNNGKINVSVQIVDAYKNIKKIISQGTFGGITRQVEVTLSPSKFSKFAYYSVSEGNNIWWTGTDTVWGPFHTQDYIRAHDHPVFYGKATTKKSLIYDRNKRQDEPYFLGGFEQGIDLPLPADGMDQIKTDATSGGWDIPQSTSTVIDSIWVPGSGSGGGGRGGGRSGRGGRGGGAAQHWETTTTTQIDTAYITFASDSVKIKLDYNGLQTSYLANAIAPNGVIYVEGMDVRLKGTVKGQFTVASEGDIYLDDDIVYSQDPETNPNASDLLGIVAKNNVIIAENSANNNDINIDASVYCENGGFGAENYNGRPVSGDINLVGGIIQNERQAVGTFNGHGVQSGFNKRYAYDNRLLSVSPPSFPGTGSYEIVSWFE
jgi:hypothetical protein